MSENPKVNVDNTQKSNFLIKVYLFTYLFWMMVSFATFYSYDYVKESKVFETIVNFDIYKLALIFLALLFIGRRMDRQESKLNLLFFIVRFFWIVLFMDGIALRFGHESLDFTFIKVVLLILFSNALVQTIRIIYLKIERENRFFKWVNSVFNMFVYAVIIGSLIYFIFTISERTSGNDFIEEIDSFLWWYLIIPVGFLILNFDLAFSTKGPSVKSLPYSLYDVGINSYYLGASLRLRFFVYLYFFVYLWMDTAEIIL